MIFALSSKLGSFLRMNLFSYIDQAFSLKHLIRISNKVYYEELHKAEVLKL